MAQLCVLSGTSVDTWVVTFVVEYLMLNEHTLDRT